MTTVYALGHAARTTFELVRVNPEGNGVPLLNFLGTNGFVPVPYDPGSWIAPFLDGLRRLRWSEAEEREVEAHA